MPTQHERVNDFETIRQMLRDMYVDGSKLAIEYRKNNGENRRQLINEWLEGGVAKTATEKGDVLHIPIDSRSVARNPFYNLWRSKSFLKKEVFLFFAIMDILHSEDEEQSLAEIHERVIGMYDTYCRDSTTRSMHIDTVKSALEEYCEQGLLYYRYNGYEVLYRRAESVGDAALAEMLSFFSEAAPCGVLGSFLMDKMEEQESVFRFKHHYLVSALDSDVLARVLDAMHGHYAVTVKNQSGNQHLVIPLRIHCSVKTGRQYLMAYNESKRSFQCFRIDQISLCDMEMDVSFPPEYCRELRRRLDETQDHVWGVTLKTNVKGETVKKHVEFLVHIDPRDPMDRHVIERLNREKRVGTVEMVDVTYRFSVDICSIEEMKHWLRSLFGNISDLCVDEDVFFSPKYCRELHKCPDEAQNLIWDVTLKNGIEEETVKKHVKFLIHIDLRDPADRHIVECLNREKRVGTVEKIDVAYRFSADVCSTKEMKPWIRSFLGYISDLRMDEGEDLEDELAAMCRMYQLGKEEQT